MERSNLNAVVARSLQKTSITRSHQRKRRVSGKRARLPEPVCRALLWLTRILLLQPGDSVPGENISEENVAKKQTENLFQVLHEDAWRSCFKSQSNTILNQFLQESCEGLLLHVDWRSIAGDVFMVFYTFCSYIWIQFAQSKLLSSIVSVENHLKVWF